LRNGNLLRVRNKIKARKKGQAQPLNVCQVSTLNHRCVLDRKRVRAAVHESRNDNKKNDWLFLFLLMTTADGTNIYRRARTCVDRLASYWSLPLRWCCWVFFFLFSVLHWQCSWVPSSTDKCLAALAWHMQNFPPAWIDDTVSDFLSLFKMFTQVCKEWTYKCTKNIIYICI